MNIKAKKIVPQIATLLVVVLIFAFFTINAQVNMDNRGIEFGYGFLSQESSFDVQFSLTWCSWRDNNNNKKKGLDKSSPF